MRTLFQNDARSFNRIADPLDAANAAGAPGAAVHEEGIELHAAIAGEQAAAAGVEGFIIFQADDGGLHRAARASATSQNAPPFTQPVTHTLTRRFNHADPD